MSRHSRYLYVVFAFWPLSVFHAFSQEPLSRNTFDGFRERIESCLRVRDFNCAELNFRIATQKVGNADEREGLAKLRKQINATQRAALIADTALAEQRSANGISGKSLGGDIVTPITSSTPYQTPESLAHDEKLRAAERYRNALSENLGQLNSQIRNQSARIDAASRGTSTEEDERRKADSARYQAIVSERAAQSQRPENAPSRIDSAAKSRSISDSNSAAQRQQKHSNCDEVRARGDTCVAEK